MSLKVFTSARAALETPSRGTDTTPTRIIYASEFTHEEDVASIRPVELLNSYSGVRAASAGRAVNTFGMSGRMSYDDMTWFGQLFFKGGVTATGGGPYLWTYNPTNTSDDLKTATIQMAQDSAAIATEPGVKLTYCMGDTLTLGWDKSNEDSAVTFDARFVSASAATQITAFTGSLSDRSVTMASCNNTTVYLDQGSSIGTTADDSVVSVTWTLNLNPVALYTLNASTAASGVYRPQHRTWTMQIVKQYENSTFWGDYADKTTQKVRIKTTTGASAIIQLDAYGTITNRTWSDVDGIVTESLTLENIWDTTSSSDHSLAVTNSVATIS